MHKHTLLLLILAYLLIVPNFIGVAKGQLRVGFYSRACPMAESVVRRVVRRAVAITPENAAKLLRLHFHDCFVEGCDGSILIQDNVDNTELEARPNLGVRGFDIIESAKARLEILCPRVVSCADIVALAARDAVSLLNGPFYDVPTGRRDGLVSRLSSARNLPEVDDSIRVIKAKFRHKGLTSRDLVLLSGGAHTIGLAACFFMQNRLYNFTQNGGSDPDINPRFLRRLKALCPFDGDVNVRIPLDWRSRTVFDAQNLRNIRDGTSVLASDARLKDDEVTRQILDSYIDDASQSFGADFAMAMVKMGNIEVKTGSEGEIRRVCSAVN